MKTTIGGKTKMVLVFMQATRHESLYALAH